MSYKNMKKNLFSFLCVVFFLFSSSGFAQNKQVTISKKQVPLSRIFSDIEKQTSYLFVYDETKIDVKRRVSVNASAKPVSQVLNLLFKGTAVVYHLEGNNIVLMNKPVQSEKKQTMRGKVITIENEPIIGASIKLAGTAQGVITDMDGNFILKDIRSNELLVVSYIGYKTVHFQASDKQDNRIVMEEDARMLDEVVVVGYGTLNKKEVTSSITSLSADDMMKGVGGADISKALQGKIGGLVIGQTNSVNDQPTFQLRGMASIVAGQEPLIVIDGFPGGDIRSLNQDDIKSIDVLKDASAGAIYGTRAAAGVILITTKSGTNTEGKVKLTYSTELSKKQAYGKPDVLTANEYVAYGVGKDYGARTDWWNECINTGNFSQKHNLSLTLGTAKANLYTSFFYENQEGLPVGESRKDYGGRLNAKFMLFDDWLEIRANVDYRQASRVMQGPGFGQALLNNPTRSPYDGNSRTGYNIWTGEPDDYNIIADAALYDNNGVDKWFKPEAIFKLNIKPIKGLSYQQTIGYENLQWEGHSYRSMYHRESLVNNENGHAKLSFNKKDKLNSEGYFSYNNEWESGHRLNAVAGYSFYQYNGEEFEMENGNFSVDGIKYWDIGKGSYLNDGKASMRSDKAITERLFALFARANYSYKDRYMLSATIRHEGSSKFGPNNRWGNFWAVSAGWSLGNEKFMEKFDWLDELKLRFGYGVTGNNNFDAAYSGKFISADENRWLLPNGNWMYTYGRSEDVNSHLGWEEKAEWNMGLDFSFFNRRLYGKVDVFRRKISNMLFYVQVPQPPFIRGYQWQNIGEMENKGWEIELGGDIIRSRHFIWNTHLNMSHSSSKVLTMDGSNTRWDGGLLPGPNTPGKAIILEAGSTVGQFYMYKFAGFSREGEFMLYNKAGEKITAGEKVDGDRRLMGNFTPKVMLGWSHNLSYKNFDLGISMHGWIRFDVYNTYTMTLGIPKRNGEMNVLKDAYGKFDHIKGEKLMSDYYLEDGSFWKIDAITLGYTLPLKKYIKYVDRLRVYGTVGNVCTFTKYEGRDPEVGITGYDGGIDDYTKAYPLVRTYTLGIQLNF